MAGYNPEDLQEDFISEDDFTPDENIDVTPVNEALLDGVEEEEDEDDI